MTYEEGEQAIQKAFDEFKAKCDALRKEHEEKINILKTKIEARKLDDARKQLGV